MNDLISATTISIKRIESFQQIIKAVRQRQNFAREMDLDIEHPQMEMVYRWLCDKVTETFNRMGTEDETMDQFFAKFAKAVKNWKQEIKVEIKSAKGQALLEDALRAEE